MFKEHYKKNIPTLQKKMNLKNVMQVPRIEKVVLSMGVGEALTNPKILDHALKDLSQIAGQKVSIRRAKKAVAQFKIRKGIALGGSVTLRRNIMWSFLDRLIHFALPLVRDFKGLPTKGFDGNGNYSFGIKEQIVFPEVNYDKVDAIRGFNVTICTSTPSNDMALVVLKNLGFPFRK